MKRFFSSLYGKVSIIFLVLLILLGMVQIYFSIQFTSDFFMESDQKLNRHLARDLAKTFSPFLVDSIDYAGIEHAFHEMMVMNPRVEFYLLDNSGNLLAYFAEPEKIKRMRVDMDPVMAFLNTSEDFPLPLLGDDPRSTSLQKPISATQVKIGPDMNGYLYVILGGEQYDSALAMVEDSYIFRSSAVVLIVTFIITAIIGLLLFFLLTKRLRLVTDAVGTFEKGDYKQQIKFSSGDEIGQLAQAFNKMADTITANMEEIKNNDRLRRELIANISHDLRSPLASVQGYLETIMMRDNKLSDSERRSYLDTVYKNIERLNRLVYDLFELSKLDAGQSKPHPELFSISELTQDVVLKYKPLAEKEDIDIETDFPEHLPQVKGDIAMIERALSNLLENALNFTGRDGRVAVQLSEEKDRVTIMVSDNGMGIPQKDLPYVFDRFYRADKSRSTEGTGLGLAITKKIIEAHNSEIKVHSEENKGTRFIFDIHKT